MTIRNTMSHPQYQEPCGWQSLLIRRCPEPALDGAEDYDLVVIGAGFTGLAAARTWAEARPGERVAVIDASIVGEGSPGRNSGFMLEIALADDADPAAVGRMARCNALLGHTMETLRGLVRDHGIRCQLARTGTYRGAATARGVRYLENYRAFLDAAGLAYERLDSDALEARLGTRYYRYGLYSPDCSLVQPAALIRGLADALPVNVRLYEETPAVAVEREADVWRVDTPGGMLRAPRVLLANNGFARELGAGLRSRLVVMYTYAGLTAPLEPTLLDALGSEASWGLLPAHRLGSTLRRTAEGRLMVRSFYGYEREAHNAPVAAQLEACLLARFPQLARSRAWRPLEHVWGGATGFTYNGAPVWGEIAPGLLVSAGCNGGGVVKGTLLGTLLAKQALGAAIPDVGQLFGAASWMPPEPVRQLGFALLSRLGRRAAGLET
ncbi:MAG: NAD(P)/FAD-dependent oxidoreductase [Pseudomonadales bacterium]